MATKKPVVPKLLTMTLPPKEGESVTYCPQTNLWTYHGDEHSSINDLLCAISDAEYDSEGPPDNVTLAVVAFYLKAKKK